MTLLDGFEDGDMVEWTAGTFDASTTRSYAGSYSAYSGQVSPSNEFQNSRTVVSGGKQLSNFSCYWQETTWQYGSGIQLKNSNGGWECGFATNNPQWNVSDGTGAYNEVYAGDGYDRWIYVEFTFDWANGQYDYYIEDLQSGSTAMGTYGLASGVDVETVQFVEASSPGTLSNPQTGASRIETWFDDLRYDNLAGYVDHFEDGDWAEYSLVYGSSADVNVQTSTVTQGENALNVQTGGSDTKIHSASGLERYPSQNDTFEFHFRAASSSSAAEFGFGAQNQNLGYAAYLDVNSDGIELRRYTGTRSYTTLASANVTLATDTWYTPTIEWGGDGTISLTFGGTTISGTDTNYTEGGIWWRSNDPQNSFNNAVYYDAAKITVNPPKNPSNVSLTVDADDQVTLTWDSVAGADDYDIQMNRDGSGWVSSSAGPSNVTDDGSATYSATYTATSDQAYNSFVGVDSSFQFRVRANNLDGSSGWSTSNTQYTTPVPPRNPSISRPGASTIDVTWTAATDIGTDARTDIEYREDTGAGYGAWSNVETIGTAAKGTTVTRTYSVANDAWMDADARYQFRLAHYHQSDWNNDGTTELHESEFVFADYGNAGNVYFSDGFESGGLTNWTTTSLADADSGVKDSATLTAEASTDTGVSGPDEGTYLLELQAGDSVEKSLGDLSAESHVHVRAALAAGSMDSGAEAVGIEWSPDGGTTWIAYGKLSWEYNKQGWAEVHADIAAADLGTNCRLRITGYGGTGDYLLADRIVVSDVLHEFTALPDPSALSLDATVEDQITASWTDNGTFWPNHGADIYTQVEYRQTGATTWNTVYAQEGDLGSETFTGLPDGEEFEIRIQNAWNQPRNGGKNTWFTTSWVGPLTAITVLPAPTSLSADAVRASDVDFSWVDNADNEDGYRVLLTREQQSFEGGFGTWSGGSWTISSTQAFHGTDAAYADGVSSGVLAADEITLPTGQMAVEKRFYFPSALGTGNQHILAYYAAANNWGGPHVTLREGSLQYYDGAWHDTGYTPPTGEWVRLAASVDIANQWFSVMIIDSTGVYQPIRGGAFIPRATFTAGDARFLRYTNSEELYLDAVREFVDTVISTTANTTTATATGLLNGEQYWAVGSAYTEETATPDR